MRLEIDATLLLLVFTFTTAVTGLAKVALMIILISAVGKPPGAPAKESKDPT